MNVDSIIFDLDGTLWDSVDEVVMTWNRVLARHPGLRCPITKSEQESLMGLQMDEIARRLFVNQPSDVQTALMDECIQEENHYLLQNGARLYPGVMETLTVLKQNFRLFIVSNCQSGYIEAFLSAHKLKHLFDGFLCFGDTGTSKGENIKTIIQRNHLQHPIYVGDTQGDLNAAKFAGIPFIYAAYGFGSVERCNRSISAFGELPDLFV